jgi:predicted  nucleic acid-binding Zn-ribbon protein
MGMDDAMRSEFEQVKMQARENFRLFQEGQDRIAKLEDQLRNIQSYAWEEGESNEMLRHDLDAARARVRELEATVEKMHEAWRGDLAKLKALQDANDAYARQEAEQRAEVAAGDARIAEQEKGFHRIAEILDGRHMVRDGNHLWDRLVEANEVVVAMLRNEAAGRGGDGG